MSGLWKQPEHTVSLIAVKLTVLVILGTFIADQFQPASQKDTAISLDTVPRTHGKHVLNYCVVNNPPINTLVCVLMCVCAGKAETTCRTFKFVAIQRFKRAIHLTR